MLRKGTQKLKDWESLLDFAQSYISSAITLIECYGKEPPFKTLQNHDKAYVLSAHFLMAHGVELYLKFLINLHGGTPSTSHVLKMIVQEFEPYYRQHYNRNFLNKTFEDEVKLLDHYEHFRYPFDRDWKPIHTIRDYQSRKWTDRYASIRTSRWIQFMNHLNDVGYRLTAKLN